MHAFGPHTKYMHNREHNFPTPCIPRICIGIIVTLSQKGLGIPVVPNPFVDNHVNAHGRSGIYQTLREVPEYAVVDLAHGRDGEPRHRQRHACDQHKRCRPDFEICYESVHTYYFY